MVMDGLWKLDDTDKRIKLRQRLVEVLDEIFDMFYNRNKFHEDHHYRNLNDAFRSESSKSIEHLFEERNIYRYDNIMSNQIISKLRDEMVFFCTDNDFKPYCSEGNKWNVIELQLGPKLKRKQEKATSLRAHLIKMKELMRNNNRLAKIVGDIPIRNKLTLFEEAIYLLTFLYSLPEIGEKTQENQSLLGGRKKRRSSTRRRQRRPSTRRRRRKSTYSFSPPSSSQLMQLPNFSL